MIRLDDLALFVRTAALGSFSAAAREVNLLPGQVSAAIQRLERELNIRLFARSARSLRLTGEGERYLPHAHDMLSALQAGNECLGNTSAELQGLLQVAMPSDLGRNVLLPLLTDFRRQHPQLHIRLFLSDQVTNVFRDPVDVALRYGPMDDANFVALPLAPENRRVLAASPDYLARYGRPTTLEQLTEHHCLLYMLNGRAYDQWAFPTQSGQQKTITVRSSLLANDADIVRRWTIAGEGILYKSWLDVSADVLAGRLEILLPEIPGEACALYLICPHREQFSPAVHLLYDRLTISVNESMAAYWPTLTAARQALANSSDKKPSAG